jgi:uncharacterized protein DUF2716
VPHPYSGIGKDWSHWGEVFPEDREAWEWMAEDETRPVQEWAREVAWNVEIRKNFWVPETRLPEPHVLYSAYEFRSDEEELYRVWLHALQRVTAPDEWVYAISGPDECWLYGYRFWPHRGRVRSRWYASPVDYRSDGQYFLAQDLSWGILALWGPGDCVFGQAMIDAFDADPPPGWRASPAQ